MKISIIIPAHNEQDRIHTTLERYCSYFNNKADLSVDFVVVLNGCTDGTQQVVQDLQKKYTGIHIINEPRAGKGLAVNIGFAYSIACDYDLIGFVDADMATQPHYFDDLITAIDGYDGVIASRYMPGSYVEPQRPFIKQWGRKIFYNSVVRLLFGLNFYDYQCGAKLFKKQTLKEIVPYLTTTQWAFDVELLYLCKLFHCTVKEIPTTWYDQAGSKLQMFGAGMRMLGNLFRLRKKYYGFKVPMH